MTMSLRKGGRPRRLESARERSNGKQVREEGGAGWQMVKGFLGHFKDSGFYCEKEEPSQGSEQGRKMI